MSLSVTARRFGLIGCAALLVGCSNMQGNQNVFTVGKAVVDTLREAPPESAPDPAIVARVANEALARTEGPVAIYHLEKHKASAVLRPIARNGDYVTWASYTGSERLSVTSKDNVLVATRGLGDDLMSSELEGLLALVKARQDGTAEIRQNYLDGENQTHEVTSVCTVRRGARENVPGATGGQVRATTMTATCRGEDETVENTYVVSDAGEILRSRHWAGPSMGHSVISRLR